MRAIHRYCCRSLPSSAASVAGRCRRSTSPVDVAGRCRRRCWPVGGAELSPTGQARYDLEMGFLARIVRSITLVGVVAAVAFVVPRAASADDRPLYYARALTSADLEGRTLRELALMRN